MATTAATAASVDRERMRRPDGSGRPWHRTDTGIGRSTTLRR